VPLYKIDRDVRVLGDQTMGALVHPNEWVERLSGYSATHPGVHTEATTAFPLAVYTKCESTAEPLMSIAVDFEYKQLHTNKHPIVTKFMVY
jgi:hypothetical protein